MITKESFLQEFNGHSNSYSRYLVIGTTIDAVIDFLNNYDPEMCVGSGYEKNGNVSFEIFGELPDLIYEITEKLQTIGYADTDWDVTYTVCAQNGENFDDFSAEYDPTGFCFRDDDDLWDAFIIITDNSTGAEFLTGAGAVDEEVMEYYQNIVETHPKKRRKKK